MYDLRREPISGVADFPHAPRLPRLPRSNKLPRRDKALERVLHKPPEWTHIAIEEVDTDNWGFGGRTTTAIRRDAKA
jgi:hypothetical protein